MSDKNLPAKILWQIYTSYPFSLEDITSAYVRLRSYDALIAACEVAKKEECKTLSDYIAKRFKPTSGSPQERLIAFLDELGIKNWVSGIPHKWDEPETGWQVFIVQDDIENPGYYHYAQFTFDLKGEFVDYEFGGEWEEPETPV